MTGGWWALLAVLVVAELAALAARQRALTRRRWAEEEAADEAFLAAIRNPGGRYFITEALGMRVGVSRHIPPGKAIVGQLPPLEVGPLLCDNRLDLEAEMRRFRMMQECRLGWDVADRSRTAPFIITGI